MIGVLNKGYTLKLHNFEGPLDILIELIQNSKMNITEISISAITDQYIVYLKTLQVFNIDLSSEFFSMAATLIYIKTKNLLPNQHNDDDETLNQDELLKRLKTYKKFKILSRELEKVKEQNSVYYHRGPNRNMVSGMEIKEPEAQTVGDLLQALFRYKGAFIRKSIPIKRREVNVEKKMEKILLFLKEQESVKFSKIAEDENTKVDKIASFLGGLELSFRQRVLLEQPELFDDFDIRRKKLMMFEDRS